MFSADRQLFAAAQRLLGAPVRELSRSGSGGNNRIFRVTTDAGTFALKAYRRSSRDARDRLGAEFAGLRYASTVAPGRVPNPIAADPKSNLALYEWIEGEPVQGATASEIAEALDLVRALHRGRVSGSTRSLPCASEAILTPDDLRAICDSLNDERGTGGQSRLARLLKWNHSTVWRKLNGKSPITQSDELAIRQILVLLPM